MRTALECLALMARRHGVDVSADRLAHDYAIGDEEPSTALLMRIAKEVGLKARPGQVSWEDLESLGGALPVMARLRNGNSVLVAGFEPAEDGGRALIIDPLSNQPDFLRIDRQKLEDAWDFKAIFAKRSHSAADEDRPFGLSWFVPQILRQRWVFAQIALVAFVLHGLALATPIYFQVVIDKVLSHNTISTLYVLTIGVALALLFNAVLSGLRGMLLLYATSKIDIRLATHTFSRLMSLPLDFFQHVSAGVLTKHMQQGGQIREFLTGRLFMTLLDATALIVFIPILFFYSVTLTAVVLGFTLLLCLIVLFIIGPYRKRLNALYEAEGARQSVLVETIQGMETVKALALEPWRRRHWDDLSATAVQTNFAVGQISTISREISGLIEKVMMVSIIFVGAHLIFEGAISIGALIAFNMLAGRVSGPIVQLISLVNDYQQTALSVRKLSDVMNQRPEQSGGGGLTPPIAGHIRYEGAVFHYPGTQRPALDRINLDIPAGAVVGIVGKSGSGKSTLTKLLQGFHVAQAGIVKIDGYDIRDIDLAHLRMRCGVVLQASFLFRGTIRHNISVTKPEASFGEIVAAAKLAGADEFIEQMPQGYDTMLEENASNLSGGQKQRLSIARALLKDPRILIFDEATSALDPDSEVIFQDNLRSIARGRTVLMVSHRLSMLVDCDAIIYLERGQLLDQGRHDVLLQRCAGYRHLWERQHRHVASSRRNGRNVAAQ